VADAVGDGRRRSATWTPDTVNAYGLKRPGRLPADGIGVWSLESSLVALPAFCSPVTLSSTPISSVL
jgi:hypothetical protein